MADIILCATQFIEHLKSLLQLQGRQIYFQNKMLGNFDTISVTLINLPMGVGAAGGGAEAMNNRSLFFVRGFNSHNPELPPPTSQVRVEQLICMDRKLKLRSKRASPDKIAEYLANFINKIVIEAPPNFTHTKM